MSKVFRTMIAALAIGFVSVAAFAQTAATGNIEGWSPTRPAPCCPA